MNCVRLDTWVLVNHWPPNSNDSNGLAARGQSMCSRHRLPTGIRCAIFVAATTLAICRPVCGRVQSAHVQIQAGTATSALRQFVEQTGLQVLFDPEVVQGRTT